MVSYTRTSKIQVDVVKSGQRRMCLKGDRRTIVLGEVSVCINGLAIYCVFIVTDRMHLLPSHGHDDYLAECISFNCISSDVILLPGLPKLSATYFTHRSVLCCYS